MTTAADIAEIYIAAWNETDVAARRAMIADTWTGDAVYVDPMAAVEGHAGVDALIAGVQERFPGFRFALIGAADGHGEAGRAKADLLIAFGAMTWPHMLARAMLAEQLWRATSILAGHPYHRSG